MEKATPRCYYNRVVFVKLGCMYGESSWQEGYILFGLVDFADINYGMSASGGVVNTYS